MLWSLEESFYFTPNCEESLNIEGRNIQLKINEIGLRERPQKEIKKNQVLLVGDSTIEGMGLNFDETFSQVLERKFKKSLDLQFLNLGIRKSGTLYQADLLRKYIKMLEPKYVIWSLTENDFNDDYLAVTRAIRFDKYGIPIKYDFQNVPTYSKDPFTYFVRGFDPMFSDFTAILRHLYLARMNYNFVSRYDKNPAICNGIELGYKLAKDNNFKIQFLIVPFGPLYYSVFKEGNLKNKLNKLIGCLRDKPFDLRIENIENNSELFQKDLMHLNAIGVVDSIDYLESSIYKFLKN